MKFLIAFLGIFCLLTSVYPCCADDSCDSDSIAASSDGVPTQNDCGLCTPFIACGACTGFVPGPAQSLISNVFYSINLTEVFGFNFNSVETDYSERLWQPPKQVIIS